MTGSEQTRAAVVGVGPAGTQQVVVVLTGADGPLAHTGTGRLRPGRPPGSDGGCRAGPQVAAGRHPAQLEDRPGRGRPVGTECVVRQGVPVKVLVTGASGMTGRALALALIARGR